MTANKTPIQELIESLSDNFSFYLPDERFWLQKEKAFAFDCFEAGVDQLTLLGHIDTKEDFEQFYSQYA